MKDKYLTDKPVAVLGAAGMVGSNIVQSLLQLKIANNIVMYDPNKRGLLGAYQEILHCGFSGARISCVNSLDQSLKDASYIITAGGASRSGEMSREDLRIANSKIARALGKAIKKHATALRFLIVVLNPTDIVGLTMLVHSGVSPAKIATLAALDSTRFRAALSSYFKVSPDKIAGACVYGEHGDKMVLFRSKVRIAGKRARFGRKGWNAIRREVVKGGQRIVKFRGRSSFQSPAYLTAKMLEAIVGGEEFPWPSGAYVVAGKFGGIMMAMDTTLDKTGISVRVPEGSPDEMRALTESYKKLLKMRDKNIADGILPPVSEWKSYNPNL